MHFRPLAYMSVHPLRKDLHFIHVLHCSTCRFDSWALFRNSQFVRDSSRVLTDGRSQAKANASGVARFHSKPQTFEPLPDSARIDLRRPTATRRDFPSDFGHLGNVDQVLRFVAEDEDRFNNDGPEVRPPGRSKIDVFLLK